MKIAGQLTKQQMALLPVSALEQVMSPLESGQRKTLICGGAVRNLLMNIPLSDVDIATVFTPQEVGTRLANAGIKTFPTGLDHGTVTAVVKGIGFEITTLRSDVQTDGRHAVVEFGTDWVADAQRRDFTFNALYCDLEGNYYDPLNGLDDLTHRTIRFIGDAEARIEEDYLRILRFFRFFSWYGEGRPDAQGLKAVSRAKAGLGQLSVERVWSELKKILAGPNLTRTLLWMKTTGVFGEVLPEAGQWGLEIIHGRISVECDYRFEADPLSRLVCLFSPHMGHAAGLSMRLKLSKREAHRLKAWELAELPGPEEALPSILQRAYCADIEGMVEKIEWEMARIAAFDQSPTKTRKALKRLDKQRSALKAWKKPQFSVNGQDLMARGVGAGPELGQALKRLERIWVEGNFLLSRDQLLEKLDRQAPDQQS